jgi:hypothetical protein
VVRPPGGALVRRAVPHYARASATRIKAQQAATRAGQLRIDDLLYFNGWLDAREAGNVRLAAIYRASGRSSCPPSARGSPSDPSPNPRAIAGPLYMPQYLSADLARSTRLDAVADEFYEEGTAAKSYDDKYILSTVFFAAVLFFAGISLRLDWRPLRIAVLGMALALLDRRGRLRAHAADGLGVRPERGFPPRERSYRTAASSP